MGCGDFELSVLVIHTFCSIVLSFTVIYGLYLFVTRLHVQSKEISRIGKVLGTIFITVTLFGIAFSWAPTLAARDCLGISKGINAISRSIWGMCYFAQAYTLTIVYFERLELITDKSKITKLTTLTKVP